MKGKNRLKTWKWWVLHTALVTLIATPMSASAATPEEQLNEVFSLIEGKHYSGTTAAELKDAAITGMLLQLNDRFTAYYNEAEWTELQNAFEQTYVGIGIQFAFTKDGMRIIQVYTDSAADKAGLQAGDVIVDVAGLAVSDAGIEDLEERLIGPENSSVKLKVLNSTTRISRDITVIRKPFHIPSVETARMDGGIGYIRISSFSSDTGESVRQAVRSFRQGTAVTALIIDLRGNPGGYLDAVQDVAASFMESGVLLHTVDRDGNRKSVSVEKGAPAGVPVTLLIDGQSASASEVFAGAMQDYGLATLIGTRTYGKGSVQQLISLETGGGLRLTIEHYLTPMQHEVNGIGITPDVTIEKPFHQTIAALRQAGARAFTVQLTDYGTFVNGGLFDPVIPVERKNGRTYVSSAALASVVSGSAVWDGAARSVTLKGPHGTAVFNENTGLLLKDGSSYMDSALFTKAFSHVKVKTTSTTVTLEW
jgi:carboxyl-terminal processing protease